MAEILAVKSLSGGWWVGWVPVHRLVTATVRFGCDNIDVTKFFGSGNEFKIFTAANENEVPVADQSEALSVTKQEIENGGDCHTAISDISDQDVSCALKYWYTKASREVEEFYSKEIVSKLAVKKDGILFSRSRILDGQRFVTAAGFDAQSLGLEIGLNLMF